MLYYCYTCQTPLPDPKDRWSLNGEDVCLGCAREVIEEAVNHEKEASRLRDEAWAATAGRQLC